MSMAGQLPNLFVIGAMKCGTSSLHDYLMQHPEVFMSTPKEVNFLSGENSHRSLDWYRSLFDTDKAVRGESSQNYSKCHHPLYAGAAQRMAELVPDAKLIYIVRDPLERYRSHIVENAYGESPEDVKWNIDNESYVKTGMYHLQISEFLKHFDASQVKYVVLEELAKNRLAVMNSVFTWLGLKPISNTSTFEFVTNDSGKKTAVPYQLNKALWFRAIRKVSPDFANLICRNDLVRSICCPHVKKIELTRAVRQRLISEFQEDVDKFRELSGLSLSEWSL